MRTYPKKLLIALLLAGMPLAGAISTTHAAPNGPYEGLGGSISGSPITVSWAANRLDTFVVGTDHQLYHKAWDTNQWLPSSGDYEYLGGLVRDGSSPATTSWGPDRLDIAVVGLDRQLYHKAWDGNHWLPAPTAYESLGGAARDGSSPAIVSRGPGRLDIFAVGQDQGLDHKAWESTRWLPSPTGFEHLGGVIADGSSPSATSWGDSRVSAFVVGTDQGLYHKSWDGTRWWDYENLGGSIVAGNSPTATSWAPGRMDIFVTGSDGQLYHKARNSYEWLNDRTMATVPITGPTKWAVLLCKTADHPEEPQGPQFFRDLFTEDGNGLGGMYDYWRDMSRGAISLAGSQVKGWYTMSQTLDQLNALSRQDKIRACIDTVSPYVHDTGTDYYAIAVMFNTPSVDSGDAGSATLPFNGVTKAYPILDLASSVWTATFTAHEMGHAYGLDHSWSRRPAIEYGDPYDIMCALNVHSYQGASFGGSGPSLDAPYREALGWIQPGAIYNSSLGNITITLAALTQGFVSGYDMAKIYAFGRADHYYTVEFHRASGWDRGLRQNVVLIHEVLPDGHSYLVADSGGPEWLAGQTFSDPDTHLSVSVETITDSQATIHISRTS